MSKSEIRKEYGISTFKGLVGSIPYAGTLLNELAFEARSRIKQDRVNNFITEFIDFMNKHSEKDIKIENLNVEQISDIFEEIILSVSKTSADHKKNIFKQILYKQVTSNDTTTDETLRFVNITNELTSLQFQILSAFSSLSDNLLKYKVQIIELQAEKKKLRIRLLDLQGQTLGDPKSVEVIQNRLAKIPRLISKKETALKRGSINPNYHSTFGVNRDSYITEVQDLIAKGLLFDFVLKSSVIDPFMHFGMTSLGRSYMNYITE